MSERHGDVTTPSTSTPEPRERLELISDAFLAFAAMMKEDYNISKDAAVLCIGAAYDTNSRAPETRVVTDPCEVTRMLLDHHDKRGAVTSMLTGGELRTLLQAFTDDIRLVTSDGHPAEAFYRLTPDGEGVIVFQALAGRKQ